MGRFNEIVFTVYCIIIYFINYIYCKISRIFNFAKPLVYYFAKYVGYTKFELTNFQEEKYYLLMARGKFCGNITAEMIYFLRFNEPTIQNLKKYINENNIVTNSITVIYRKNGMTRDFIILLDKDSTYEKDGKIHDMECGVLPF